MTRDQLEKMRDRLHLMVDGLFKGEGIALEAVIEEWGWPQIRITFAHQDDPMRGYTLVVGIEAPTEEAA